MQSDWVSMKYDWGYGSKPEPSVLPLFDSDFVNLVHHESLCLDFLWSDSYHEHLQFSNIFLTTDLSSIKVDNFE
jgi:hypothetical protein